VSGSASEALDPCRRTAPTNTGGTPIGEGPEDTTLDSTATPDDDTYWHRFTCSYCYRAISSHGVFGSAEGVRFAACPKHMDDWNAHFEVIG
jgi:hypothetical protein